MTRARPYAPVCWILAATFTPACSAPDPVLADERVATSLEAVSQTLVEQGCTGRRWVGATSSPVCPAPLPGWSMAPVFASDPGLQVPVAVPPGLLHHCLYEWALPGTDPDEVAQRALGNHLRSEIPDLAADCVVISPMQDDGGVPDKEGPPVVEGEGGWPPWRRWLWQAQRARVGVGLPPGSAPRAGIEVAVADSSPDGRGLIPMGASSHGYTMGWIVRDLVCGADGAPCDSMVTTSLAMPHVTNRDIDPVNGGYFGTPVELARAIHRAVELWKSDAVASWPAAPARPRLVLNLSVGWEPQYSGTAPAGGHIPAPAQTVLDALTHAACHGALIIAAAGNDIGDRLSNAARGPTLPAAWAATAAPGKDRCMSFEGAGYDSALPAGHPLFDVSSKAGSTPPLLHAIGGVDHADRPIASTRDRGRPLLAALGFEGVGGETDPLPVSLTGTSVAAAITSGVAAAVWSYRPELTAHEVMQLLYKSGVPLRARADFCASKPPCPEIHRVSLCAAMKDACGAGAGSANLRCPPEGIACKEPVREALSNPDLPPELEVLAGGDAMPWSDAERTEDASPTDLYRSMAMAPWVHPQPESPPCGACFFKIGSGVILELDPFYPLQLTRTTLTVRGTDAASQPVAWNYAIETQSKRFRARVDLPSSFAVHSATLSWAATDPLTGAEGSVSQQIPVFP